jgi:hypothetical protein
VKPTLYSLLALTATVAIPVAVTSETAMAASPAKQCPAPADWGVWKQEAPPRTGVDVNYVRLSADGTFYWNNIAITPKETAEKKLGDVLRIVGFIKNAQLVLDRGDADCGTFNHAVELMSKTTSCTTGRCWVGKSPAKIYIAIPRPAPQSR